MKDETFAEYLPYIRRAADRAQQAFQRIPRGDTESFFFDSAALNLHRFYNGVEQLLERIAKELDDTVPTGSAWHRQLLEQMKLEIPSVRPAVIRSATRTALDKYLGFRHVVRNLYTWDFDVPQVMRLIDQLPQTLANLEQDLKRFCNFLDAAGHADEKQ
ncbi:MAG: hypothetical protein HZB51_28405 [Chloroflexi bacterium]|nr:hypothetical protein [Chloroflexota bacterium]